MGYRVKTRRCADCGEDKPLSEFYPHRRRGRVDRTYYCKPCTRERTDAWKAANPEAQSATVALRRKQRQHVDPEYWRRRDLRRNWGITPEQFDAQLAAQDGRCPICGTNEPKGKGWVIDHCHETGELRAITCAPCNSMMGFGNDDPAVLRRAAEYLEKGSSWC